MFENDFTETQCAIAAVYPLMHGDLFAALRRLLFILLL